MSKKSRIDIRVEDEIISMLNVLENQELTENFVSKKRSEIIIDAIKTYYTMHANGKNQSQLSNMIDAQLRQIIEPLFQSQADLISKCYSVTNRNISIYNEQELKTLQLILMGTQLENTIAQLEDAEKQLSDTHERIQLLKKQRVELEKFKKDYMTFEEKFRQYGKKNRSTKTVKTVKLSTESNKENVKEDTNKETKSESSNASFGVENMFNH